jgi:hypothetical protein
MMNWLSSTTLYAGFMELCCVTSVHGVRQPTPSKEMLYNIYHTPQMFVKNHHGTDTYVYIYCQRSRKIHEDPGNIHEHPRKIDETSMNII